jgi:hypothetical protein
MAVWFSSEPTSQLYQERLSQFVPVAERTIWPSTFKCTAALFEFVPAADQLFNVSIRDREGFRGECSSRGIHI